MSTSNRDNDESMEMHENEVYGITHKAQADRRSKPNEISRIPCDLAKKGTNENTIETTPNIVYGMIAESHAFNVHNT